MAPDWQIDIQPSSCSMMIITRPDMSRSVPRLRFMGRQSLIAIFFAMFLSLAGPGRLLAQKDPYAEFIAQTNPRTPEEERKGFHLPPGFEVQLVAAEPDVRKPININFDDRGRLWVTESVEYPFAAKAPGRDCIGILQ